MLATGSQHPSWHLLTQLPKDTLERKQIQAKKNRKLEPQDSPSSADEPQDQPEELTIHLTTDPSASSHPDCFLQRSRYDRLFWIVSILDQSYWTCQAGVSDLLHILLYNLCSSGQHHLSLQERPDKDQNTPGASQKPHGDIRKHTLTAYLPSKPSTTPSVWRVWPVLGKRVLGSIPVPPPSQSTLPPTPASAEGKNLLGCRDFDFAQEGPSNVNMRAGFDAIRFSEI